MGYKVKTNRRKRKIGEMEMIDKKIENELGKDFGFYK